MTPTEPASPDLEFNRLATFVWERAQARENERAHGLDIVAAAGALEDPMVLVTALGEEEGFEAIGLSRGRLLSVRYEIEENRIRIQSAWRAIPTEEALYGR